MLTYLNAFLGLKIKTSLLILHIKHQLQVESLHFLWEKCVTKKKL